MCEGHKGRDARRFGCGLGGREISMEAAEDLGWGCGAGAGVIASAALGVALLSLVAYEICGDGASAEMEIGDSKLSCELNLLLLGGPALLVAASLVGSVSARLGAMLGKRIWLNIEPPYADIRAV